MDFYHRTVNASDDTLDCREGITDRDFSTESAQMYLMCLFGCKFLLLMLLAVIFTYSMCSLSFKHHSPAAYPNTNITHDENVSFVIPRFSNRQLSYYQRPFSDSTLSIVLSSFSRP